MSRDLTHPERVAANVPPEYRVVALLHDAIEDGHLTMDDAEGALDYSQYVALSLLTRGKNETYAEYIEMIRWAASAGKGVVLTAGRCALAVKIADLKDNLSRPEGAPPGDLEDRYRKALAVLEPVAEGLGL